MDVWARIHNAVGREKGLEAVWRDSGAFGAIFAGAEHGRVPVLEKYLLIRSNHS
jgi:hypothetical protein